MVLMRQQGYSDVLYQLTFIRGFLEMTFFDAHKSPKKSDGSAVRRHPKGL